MPKHDGQGKACTVMRCYQLKPCQLRPWVWAVLPPSRNDMWAQRVPWTTAMLRRQKPEDDSRGRPP